MAERNADIRLVVVQGPLQALVACASVRYAERRWELGLSNIMLFGGVLADDESAHYGVVRQAAVDCAVAVAWDRILEFGDFLDAEALRRALAPSGAVAEVVCCRNWQPVNEEALAAFPEARRVVVGDGLGVIDADRDLRRPQFDMALPVIPQPLRADSLQETDMEVVPRQELLDVIAITRERSAELRRVDDQLAHFAHDGLLVLINYLTESYDSTLRGEIELVHRAVRATRPRPGAPIVVKPHPRSSLGQAPALARRLRAEGHAVRIMGRREFGHYPIELFERLLAAVEHVEAQGSSSALSILYLHGVKPTVVLPPGAGRLVLPRGRRRLLRAPVELARNLDRLADWEGHTPFPPPSDWRPTLGDRIRGRLVRPVMWAPAGAWRRRVRPWTLPAVPKRVLAELGVRRPHVITDDSAGVAWLLRPDDAGLLGVDALKALQGEPTERVLAVLEILAATPGLPIGLVAATFPSSHAPGWQRWWHSVAGIRLVDGARLSAEQCEELLEATTDVLVRVPEAGLSARPGRARTDPGFVAFACTVRGRPGTTSPGHKCTDSAGRA